MIAWGVLADNTPDEVAGIVANFGGPDEVPIVDHHHGGPVGWVRNLIGYGSNVLFVADLSDDAAISRLERGPVPISLEMNGRGVLPRTDERGIVLPVLLPSPYRGRIGRGWTLQAIAMLRDGDRPAAAGSALWAAGGPVFPASQPLYPDTGQESDKRARTMSDAGRC